MPASSEKQRRFMCSDLSRLRAKQATKTGMSEKQLREYCKGKVKGKKQ